MDFFFFPHTDFHSFHMLFIKEHLKLLCYKPLTWWKENTCNFSGTPSWYSDMRLHLHRKGWGRVGCGIGVSVRTPQWVKDCKEWQTVKSLTVAPTCYDLIIKRCLCLELRCKQDHRLKSIVWVLFNSKCEVQR